MLDANQKFAGAEPKFSTELSQIDLSKALSWYAQNKDSKDSQKYASDFFKKNINTKSIFIVIKYFVYCVKQLIQIII